MLDSRVPPHSIEAEQAVLGRCLVDGYAVAVAMGCLESAHFYRPEHREVFEAIAGLYVVGKPVDMVQVAEALGPKGLEAIGGYGLLSDLVAGAPMAVYLEEYAEAIRGHAERRKALAVLHEAIGKLHQPTDDEEDPVTECLGSLLKLTGQEAATGPRTFGAILEGTLEQTRERSEMPQDQVPTMALGLSELDGMIRLGQDDMFVLGARPSTGKTALALQFITAIAQQRHVLFFSLEMSAEALARRYFQTLTNIGSFRQMDGNVDRFDLEKLGGALKQGRELRLKVDDRPALKVAQMMAAAHREQILLGGELGLIVIDHAVKIRPDDPRANGHQAMSQISRDVKAMARRLKVPVMLLTQLNRGVEKRGGKPIMSDLRESGSLEEDADQIVFLHRPDRGGVVSETELIVAKNRNGPVGELRLEFEAKTMRFRQAPQGPQAPPESDPGSWPIEDVPFELEHPIPSQDYDEEKASVDSLFRFRRR